MSDYNEEFDRLRRNRVEVSFHKYGPARKNFGEGRVDALETAQMCIDAFRRDPQHRTFGRCGELPYVPICLPVSGRVFQSNRKWGKRWNGRYSHKL